MSNVNASKPPAPRTHQYAFFPAILSYLVPGLGQIVQGRIGKGLMFLVCIYTMFFFGLNLGAATVPLEDDEYRVGGNVFIPDIAERVPVTFRILGTNVTLSKTMANLYHRPQYLAQFWVGVAAWPAIWQYRRYDERAEENLGNQIVEARAEGKQQEVETLKQKLRDGDPVFGHFQRTPSEKDRNVVENFGDKLNELGWVYTVIAGVLNIMVIYDALAGPAFPALRLTPASKAAT